jgi:hypothetical protein
MIVHSDDCWIVETDRISKKSLASPIFPRKGKRQTLSVTNKMRNSILHRMVGRDQDSIDFISDLDSDIVQPAQDFKKRKRR